MAVALERDKTRADPGLDMGANLHQDRGGDQTLTNGFGDTLLLSPKNDVGFYGGIKGGWVFGTGAFRPTIEGDLFYNRGDSNKYTKYSFYESVDRFLPNQRGAPFPGEGAPYS